MSAVINTNLASLFAQNSLNNAQSNLATSVQRLSSGLRINSAKDDASGLSIAQTMAGHIKSLDQAALNAQQAVNLAQTADTSLSTVQDILLRMQQLSVEGANGSLSNTQRGAIVTELGNLNTQINSFAAGTTYNGITLLGSGTNSLGSGGTLPTTITSNVSLTVSTPTIASTAASGTYTLVSAGGGTSLTLGNGFASQTIQIGTTLATSGGTQTLNFNSLGLSFSLTSQSTADTSAAVVTALAGLSISVAGPSTSSLSFQIGASPTASGDSISISEYNVSTQSGSYGSLNKVGSLISNTVDSNSLGYLSTTQTTVQDSQWKSAFNTLNQNVTSAINDISSARATLGATMNQLGFINTTVEAQSANEQAARSTVVDTNFSAETANLTKGQIMQQAATAMLAQANQMPNVILSLLK